MSNHPSREDRLEKLLVETLRLLERQRARGTTAGAMQVRFDQDRSRLKTEARRLGVRL